MIVFRRAAQGMWLLFLILPLACQQRPTSETSATSSAEAPEIPTDPARKTLHEMVAAYRAARSYADHARFELQGAEDEMAIPCTVAYAAPNRLRLELIDGYLICDGDALYAQTPLFPDQVIEQPAPEQMTLATLLADPWMTMAFGMHREQENADHARPWIPPQLLLLFAADPLRTLLADGQRCELLESAKIGEATCDRLLIEIPETGRFTFWIRRDDRMLLRLDFPPFPQFPERFWRLEMTDAVFNGEISAEAFQMVEPEGARHVKMLDPFFGTDAAREPQTEPSAGPSLGAADGSAENTPAEPARPQPTEEDRRLVAEQEKTFRESLQRGLTDNRFRLDGPFLALDLPQKDDAAAEEKLPGASKE